MSTSIGGLNLFMKTVIDAEPWNLESSLIPMPWREIPLGNTYTNAKKLKVAVMWHDGVVRPHPPITRGLEEVVQKLSGLNWVEIVDWKPYKHDEACKTPNPQSSSHFQLSIIFKEFAHLITHFTCQGGSYRHFTSLTAATPTQKLSPPPANPGDLSPNGSPKTLLTSAT